LSGAVTGTGTTAITTTYNGTVPVNKGGTGQTSYTNGQLLIGNTTGNTLTKATLTGTTNQITVTNGNGSITLSTPQDIDTTASPTFAGATLTSATTSNPILLITNTNTDGAGPRIRLRKNSSSPADNDILGDIEFQGDDSGGTNRTYAYIRGISTDVTTGTIDGDIQFWTRVNNTLARRLTISNGIDVVGSITVSGNVDGVDIAGNINQDVRSTASPTFAALTVNGNITVTGNVDGVDIAGSINQDVRTTASPTFAGLTVGTGLIVGGFGSATTSGTTDWNHSTNARSGQGYTLLLGTATNGPGGAFYYHPFSFEYSSKDGTGNKYHCNRNR
jgi:hypothetical protein